MTQHGWGAQISATPLHKPSLRGLGYAYGEDFVTEPRSPAGQVERFPALVAELMGLRVDVIVAAGPALAALK